MTYFPHFPRVKQDMLNPTSRKKTQDEVILAFHRGAGRRGSRPLLHCCGTCNSLRQLLSSCARKPCIARSDRSNASTNYIVGLLQRLPRTALKNARPVAWRACPNWTSTRASSA